jgi:anaerobic selenocysteine-containing dehydrogenase
VASRRDRIHRSSTVSGRGSASQWHKQTPTPKSAVLRKLYPEKPFVEINPADAKALGIRQNEWVTVESQRGRMRAMAFMTHAVAAGQLFIPMHYEETNRLTDAVFDPYSKQPSYKACAVRIRRDSPCTINSPKPHDWR